MLGVFALIGVAVAAAIGARQNARSAPVRTLRPAASASSAD
jgi:hypothetical protein